MEIIMRIISVVAFLLAAYTGLVIVKDGFYNYSYVTKTQRNYIFIILGCLCSIVSITACLITIFY
jgi:hypothetical protein